MEDGLDGAAEGVIAAEEGSFLWQLRGSGFRGSVVGSSGAGGFQDVECEAESLEGTRR